MKQTNIFSTRDVAHKLGVHEQVVLAWAHHERVRKLGREAVFESADLRRLELALDVDAMDDEEPDEQDATESADERSDGNHDHVDADGDDETEDEDDDLEDEEEDEDEED